MILLYTDQFQETIEDILTTIEGLKEAVKVEPMAKLDPEQDYVLVADNEIRLPLSWEGKEPPVLFPPVPFEKEALVAVLLSKLGYEQEALKYTHDVQLQTLIKLRLQLQYLDQRIVTPTSPEDHYYSLHNHAVLMHYAGHFIDGEPAENVYKKALEAAPTEAHQAFTARHFAVLLSDQGDYTEAESCLRQAIEKAPTVQARHHLKMDLINTLMLFRMHLPGGTSDIKSLIADTIPYFEKLPVDWQLAMLCLHAAEIANHESNYTESLGYVTRAISIYEELELYEFLASANLQKGTLLFTWAQQGNPQFYQPAIDIYQEALKTFTREAFPFIFAEIHHNLAVIYAEMPTDEQKKAMWAAFSASSFLECLGFYQKDIHPYEYAMVANNYANALLKYPAAKTGDNAEKAIHYYLEALEIRTEDKLPEERAHTALNYLEACWRVHNINPTMERARYKDMLQKAREIKSLTADQSLVAQAQAHLDQLAGLGISIITD